MGVPNRTENMTAFARKLLCTLGIAMPDEKQVAFFKSLLMDVGIIFFELSFDRQLTSQETACLLLVARGKNIKEIAAILDVHNSTVKTYFNRIKQKLNCKTMEQAVFEGVRYCYIQNEVIFRHTVR